jgi:mannose-1-phosphate guanylyltransferase
LADVFIPYFGDGSKWGIKILYAVEKEPLGTGGAMRNAAELLQSDEPIVIFNGDVLSRHSIAEQIRFHEEQEADVTLHLLEVDDARAFGCVPTDSAGQVTAFLEKMENPVTNFINAGCYIFSPDVITEIPLGTVVSVERETFPALIAQHRPVFGYKEQAYWLDVGTPAALFKGSRDLVAGPYLAMAGATIAQGAVITGGTAIGAHTSIASGCQIDDCIIGDHVIIDSDVKLSQCFIAQGTHVTAGVEKSHRYLSTSADLAISL